MNTSQVAFWTDFFTARGCTVSNHAVYALGTTPRFLRVVTPESIAFEVDTSQQGQELAGRFGWLEPNGAALVQPA